MAKALGAPAGLQLARLRDRDRPGRPALADRLRHGRGGRPPSAGSTAGICRCRTTAGSPRRWWSRNGDVGREGRSGRRERTGRGGMRAVWRVADVRAAEAGLMAHAAGGHADAAGRRRAGPPVRAAARRAGRGLRRAGCCCWSAPATTAATRSTPGRGWPARGAGVSRPAADPRPGARRRAGRAARRRRPAGRPDLPARVDLVLDGIVGIGGTGGLRATADEVVAAPRRAARTRRRPGHGGGGGRAQRRRGRHRRRAAAASGRPRRSAPT